MRAECDYRAPLRFSDLAEIEMSLAHLGTRSVAFRYRVHRVAPGEPLLCADGRVTCAVTDLQSFRATPVPERLRALFLELGEVEG